MRQKTASNAECRRHTVQPFHDGTDVLQQLNFQKCPMVAMDRAASLASAWALSRHNGWRLAIVVGLLPAAFSSITEKLSRQNASMLEQALLAVTSAVFIVIEVVALSLSYQTLLRSPTGNPPYDEA